MATDLLTDYRPAPPTLPGCGHPGCTNATGTNRRGLCSWHNDIWLRRQAKNGDPEAGMPDAPAAPEIAAEARAIVAARLAARAGDRRPLAARDAPKCAEPQCARTAGTNLRGLCTVCNARWRHRARRARQAGRPEPPAVKPDVREAPVAAAVVAPAVVPALERCAVPICPDPMGGWKPKGKTAPKRLAMTRFGFEGKCCQGCFNRLWYYHEHARPEVIAAVMRGEPYPPPKRREPEHGILTSAQVCAVLLLRNGDPNADERDEIRAPGNGRTRWEHLSPAEASRRIRRLFGRLDLGALCATDLAAKSAGDEDDGED